VSADAVEVLVRVGSEEATAVLVAIAADPQRTAAAVDALARATEAQLPWLGRGLAHADVHVRCAVVEALGRMRHRGASALLAGALADEALAVRAAAAHALRRLDLRAARETGHATAPGARVPDA
jgi:HEAT repeat protein